MDAFAHASGAPPRARIAKLCSVGLVGRARRCVSALPGLLFGIGVRSMPYVVSVAGARSMRACSALLKLCSKPDDDEVHAMYRCESGNRQSTAEVCAIGCIMLCFLQRPFARKRGCCS